MSGEENPLKGVIVLAVDKSLTNLEEHASEKVIKHLKEKFNCYLSDCLEKPEYLKTTLDELYGDSYEMIFNSIKSQLSDETHHNEIKKFLQVLECC